MKGALQSSLRTVPKILLFKEKVFHYFAAIILGLFFANTSVGAEELVFGNGGIPFHSKQALISGAIVSDGGKSVRLRLRKLPLPSSLKEAFLYVPFEEYKDGGFIAYGGKVLVSRLKLLPNPITLDSEGSFEQSAHILQIKPDSDSFLYNHEQIGNFSISFLFRPYQMKRTMEIMRKLVYYEGRRQGFQVLWSQEKIHFRFHNFFKAKHKRQPLVEITSRDHIMPERNTHVLLRFDSANGQLSLFLNGVEQESLLMTETGTPESTVLTAAFHPWDRSPLVIAQDYLGILDEIYMVERLLPPALSAYKFGRVARQGDRFVQPKGTYLSEIVDTGTSASRLLSMKRDVELPEGSFAQFLVRASDKPMDANLSEEVLPFRPVPPNGRLNQVGRYVQWKSILSPDPLGLHSPEIKSVRVRFLKNPPPSAPIRLQVLSVGPERVTLLFQRNAELDVIRNGRYHIYYGIEPYRAEGMIRYKSIEQAESGGFMLTPFTDANSRYQTNDLRLKNRIVVEITNSLIVANKLYMKSKPTLFYENPVLQSGIPLYFWVTACDNAWSEDPSRADHESSPSKAVVARPE